MLRPDAERGQAGDGEQADRLTDPGEAVVDGGGGTSGQQPGGFGIPVKGGAARLRPTAAPARWPR